MDKCRKERIQIASLRTGISAATGGVLWFAAGWLAQHYGYDLTSTAQAGLGVAAALIMWLATKPMFSFTEECILMQEATSARSKTLSIKADKSGKSASTAKPSGKSNVFLPQQRAAAATSGSTPRAAQAVAAASQSNVTLTAGKLFDKGRITVDVSRNDAGQAEIIVTARGLSASEFKGNNGNHGLRQKLENISGISWENPKNLGEGKRIMSGVVKSSNEGEVASKLSETVARYSA